MDNFRTIHGPGRVAWVDPEWESILLPEIERRFDPPRGTGIAHPVGRGPHLAYLPAGAPKRVFVRFHRRGGAMRWLGDRYCGTGRVPEELEVTRAALSRGLPVPRPLAGAAWRRGFCWRLAVVTEEIPDAVGFRAFYEAAPPDARRAASTRVRALLAALVDAGIRHPDLHFDNFLVSRADPALVFVIDFDRASARGNGADLASAYRDRLRRHAARHEFRLDPQDAALLGL